MSDPVTVALIGVFTSAIPSCMAAFFAYRAAKHAARSVLISRHTEENTNHMKDELVALTAKSSHAEGFLEGRAESSK